MPPLHHLNQTQKRADPQVESKTGEDPHQRLSKAHTVHGRVQQDQYVAVGAVASWLNNSINTKLILSQKRGANQRIPNNVRKLQLYLSLRCPSRGRCAPFAFAARPLTLPLDLRQAVHYCPIHHLLVNKVLTANQWYTQQQTIDLWNWRADFWTFTEHRMLPLILALSNGTLIPLFRT